MRRLCFLAAVAVALLLPAAAASAVYEDPAGDTRGEGGLDIGKVTVSRTAGGYSACRWASTTPGR